MLNESLFSSSFDELKDLLFQELTIFHVALIYVLMYVLYKALGRYIYFKPQEHGSKINRTFLTLSLLVVLLHTLSGFSNFLPILPEYRWIFALSGLLILIAPMSILMSRIIWKYDSSGYRRWRDWHHNYLPIPKDYYKTQVSKNESHGAYTNSWEEEGVESTRANIHSDALLNIIALAVFIVVSATWTHRGLLVYGWFSYAFAAVTCLTIAGIFFDRAVFSWIDYVQNRQDHG